MAKATKAKKKTVPKTTAARKARTTGKVSKIAIRMYRGGTGDFFALKFFSGPVVSFTMVIDCGCINGTRALFEPMVKDLVKYAGKDIDLLVVTHEHADHINGFEKASALYSDIHFKKLWFAWTEDDTNAVANEYRKKYTRVKMALAGAADQLKRLAQDHYYEKLYGNEFYENAMLKEQQHFIDSVSQLQQLHAAASRTAPGKIPTMADLLRTWQVIKEDTEVSFLEPGDLQQGLPGAGGIRFFVLGPPKELAYLDLDEAEGETYAKRKTRSTLGFSMVNALVPEEETPTDLYPFDKAYEETRPDPALKKSYESPENAWRNIDHDWLYGAGSLALKLQQNINNTSLVLAIQFEDSRKVLLFPGDAEYGNWKSWHDGLQWTIQKEGKNESVDAAWLLGHTVFYKISHHLSQNGTATARGLDLMTQDNLAAMATLDLQRILWGWKNTMPNDYLGAELIKKTKGKIFFTGDREYILKNIETNRVSVPKSSLERLEKLNKPFDGKFYIDYEVEA